MRAVLCPERENPTNKQQPRTLPPCLPCSSAASLSFPPLSSYSLGFRQYRSGFARSYFAPVVSTCPALTIASSAFLSHSPLRLTPEFPSALRIASAVPPAGSVGRPRPMI